MSAIGTPALLILSKAPLFAIWMGVLHILHFPLRLAEFTQLLVLPGFFGLPFGRFWLCLGGSWPLRAPY